MSFNDIRISAEREEATSAFAVVEACLVHVGLLTKSLARSVCYAGAPKQEHSPHMLQFPCIQVVSVWLNIYSPVKGPTDISGESVGESLNWVPLVSFRCCNMMSSRLLL